MASRNKFNQKKYFLKAFKRIVLTDGARTDSYKSEIFGSLYSASKVNLLFLLPTETSCNLQRSLLQEKQMYHFASR